MAKLADISFTGDDDTNIGYSLTFRGNTSLASGGGRNLLAPVEGARKRPLVTTMARRTRRYDFDERLPLVEVDLSKLAGIDPASVSMTMSGIERVSAQYDAVPGRLTYQYEQRLRDVECSVAVRLKQEGEENEDVVSWRFFLDRTPWYLEERKGVSVAEADSRTKGTAGATRP